MSDRVQKSTVEALDRTLKENRELRRLMFETEKKPATFRHCQYCGRAVCECGLEGFAED